MQLSGNLCDVSIIDVLQILGLTGKPGQLVIERPDQRAELVLSRGHITAASLHPQRGYMTGYLLQRGEVDFETLHEALELQRHQPVAERRPIGSFLVELGAISESQLHQALYEHIQAVVNEVASWTTGQFSFLLAKQESPDGFGLHPTDLTPEVDFNLQKMLLEAARVHDEAQHAAVHKASHTVSDSGLRLPTGGTDDSRTAEPAPILLITDDLLLQYSIGALSSAHPVEMITSPETLERRLQSTAAAPITVVLDVDFVATGCKQPAKIIEYMHRLLEQSDGMEIVTCGREAPPSLLELMHTGRIRYHVPRPSPDEMREQTVARCFVEAVACQTRACVEDEQTASPATGPQEQRQMLQRLYRSVMSLRRTGGSMTVCREVLRYIAGETERAALLAVQKDHLVVLGQVGLDGYADEAPMDGSLRLPLGSGSVFAHVVRDQRLDQVEINAETEDDTLDALYEHMGPPARPEAIVIPMVVKGRTFAVIYADNGARDEPMSATEACGILVEHGSGLLENMWLSRGPKRPMDRPTRATMTGAADVTIESKDRIEHNAQ